MKKFIIIAGISVLVLVIAGVALVVAFGSLLRSGPFSRSVPRDLGVTYTEADYLSAEAKMNAGLASGTIQETFTQAELTALLNGCQESECVLEDVQVRTHANGTFEMSGMIDRDRVVAFVQSSGARAQDLQGLQSALAYLPSESAFYVKAEVDGEDDTFFFALDEAVIARLPIPSSLEDEINAEIIESVNGYLASMPGTQVRSMAVTEEGLRIDASMYMPEAPVTK